MGHILLTIGRLAAYSTPSATPDLSELSLSEPTVESRSLTIEELRSFQDPENLHGKQFLLSPNTAEAGLYEVIGYSKSRDKSVQYSVLFDDCPDPIMVDADEMLHLLEDSAYLPVS